jgi:hypothetical protein
MIKGSVKLAFVLIVAGIAVLLVSWPLVLLQDGLCFGSTQAHENPCKQYNQISQNCTNLVSYDRV